MNAITLSNMAILSGKNKNIRGGRPKNRYSLHIDRESRNLCIFIGYTPREMKQGEEIALSLKDFEALMTNGDLKGIVTLKVRRTISLRKMMINCVKHRLSRKTSYPQDTPLA